MFKTIRERTFERLTEIGARGLTRRLVVPCGVDLSSNDYLGLAQHPKLKAAMRAGVQELGCGATASRLLRGERAVFATVEQKFAEFKNTRRALFFGSGYAANIGVLTAFLEEGDVVFSDELNHASIIDGLRLSKARRVVFPHNNVDALAKLLREDKANGQKFLVVESLYSMGGDFAPLREFAEICQRTNTNLIVDEAHAVGVYGERGSGLIEQTGVGETVFLSINTAGKALGASGAFAAGDDWAIEYLVQRARSFIFSTAPPPSVAAALLASLEVVRDEPERRLRLLQSAMFLRSLLHESGIAVSLEPSPIIPIIIGDSAKAVHVAENLQCAGFDARAVRPPTVSEGTARLRISLNSELDKNVLSRFVETLKKHLPKL